MNETAMRDKLIELIEQGEKEVPCKYNENIDCTGIACKSCEIRGIADALIANGVILPPCKVGDKVWDKYGYTFEIQKIEIFNDIMLFRCGNRGTEDYMAFYDFEVGSNIFLTKEEAEKALKEKENEKNTNII